MNLKDKMEESKEKAKQWFVDHQNDILYGCYIAATIGAAVIPIVHKARKNHYEHLKDYRIYDRSNGFYWETRRKLTNNQKMIIEQRHLTGEPYGQILSDMKLLKR